MSIGRWDAARAWTLSAWRPRGIPTRRSPADLEAGTLLFRQQCSPCHGEAGVGGPGGPSLQDRVFRNGRSDWALFRTITLGLPGTAMAGRTLPRDDTWRLVTYLKQILAGAAAR